MAFNSLNGPSFSSLKAFAHATSVIQGAYTCACCAKSLQSCPTLCDPMNCSPPGFSVHGILQTRILEWVAISFSRGSSQPTDWSQVSCIVGGFFTTAPHGEPTCVCVGMHTHTYINMHTYTYILLLLLLLSCFSHVWLCDPTDHSPPGSSVHGIFQARVLEWGATEC